MATVNFLYRSSKPNAPLNVRLLFRHNGIDYSRGVRTELHIYSRVELIQNPNLNALYYWKNQHKKNTKDIEIENKQTQVNLECNKIKNHILKEFEKESIDYVINNKNWLKKCLNDYYNPPLKTLVLPDGLLSYFDFYLNTKKHNLSNQTLKNYNSVKNLLKRYQGQFEQELKISSVDLNFKTNFEKYCIDQGYAHNTISKAIQTLKTICLDAKYNGIETSYQLEKVKLKEIKVESIYLSFEEIDKIENVKLEVDYLDNARDWLIISCFLGQRVSDMMRFNSKIIREENGKLLIEFTQIKTKKMMTIPLHPKVIKLLDKRNGEFPRPISEQKYNHYIKLVAKEAKLKEKVRGSKMIETNKGSKKYRKKVGVYEKWELITSHIGRRSFATNFYGKIPTSFLIYMTGHSSEQMFLTYIGKSNKDLAIELTNYF